MPKTKRRHFSAREINHLLDNGFEITHLEKYGSKPVEYITGIAEFMGRDFLVNEHTLIPRIETEKLVEIVSHFCLQTYEKNKVLTIADIGTGSGCIGLSLFLELSDRFDNLTMYLSDSSEQALEVTKKNLDILLPHNLKHKIKILKSDLLLDYPDSAEIDIIVANLPYIPTERLEQLDESVKDFEPYSALDGGSGKGLNLVNNLVAQSEKLVQRPQVIFQEIDEYVLLKDLRDSPIYDKGLIKDSFEKTRFAVFRHKELS